MHSQTDLRCQDEYSIVEVAITSLLHEIGKKIDLNRIEELSALYYPSTYQEFVRIADCAAAGIDRTKTDKNVSSDFAKVKSRPLVSLFSQVQLDKPKPTNSSYYPSKRLCWRGDEIFPKEKTENNVENYQELYANFFAEIKLLKNTPVLLLVETLMGILQKYCSLVPASAVPASARFEEIPDVSLYDHSHMTAAIACALFEHNRWNQIAPDQASKQEESLLLFSGDISGIQSYLLDLPNQAQPGTAKILRAKSFYITALSRVAVVMILKKLGLPACNCIRDAGGQFTILAHNTPKTQETIVQVQRELDQWMLEKFCGQLAIILSPPVNLSDKMLREGKYSAKMSELRNKMEIAKRQRFQSILQDNGTWDDSSDSFLVMKTIDPRDTSNLKELKTLGGNLTSMRRFCIISEPVPANQEDISFFDQYALRILTEKQEIPVNAVAAYCVNPGINTDESENTIPIAPYFLAQHVPRLNREMAESLNQINDSGDDEYRAGQVKPFELIANEAIGIPSIAVLKADVDRLGQIFSRGLGEEQIGKEYSMSRLATLSRMLNGFFTGYLESLLSQEKYENIYTEYAGGDDLLLVGPWDMIFTLANDLRQKFREYTCQNDNITLSAAIVMGGAKFPIASLVREADELLDKAKSDGRNKIGVIGETYSWESFQQGLNLGKELFSKSESKRGFLYRLLQYSQMAKQAEKGSIRDLLWFSQLRYDMGRNLHPVKDADLRNIVEKLIPSFQKDQRGTIQIATHYALYCGRGSSKNSDTQLSPMEIQEVENATE